MPLAVIAGALAFAGPSRAGGLFDFLFGGFQNREPNSPSVQSYAEPPAPGPIVPAPLAGESVRQGIGGTGRSVTYCVRLCDGQHFPMAHLTNATPVETCRAMCPASKTKVFFGGEIGGAVARDGARYADLENAFLYRKQIVANCTCNGHDALGLMPLDIANDATLRPGDIVATKDGLMAYGGRTANGQAFTRVEPSSVAAQLNSVTAPARFAKRNEPGPDDDPGTITPAQRAPNPVALDSPPHD